MQAERTYQYLQPAVLVKALEQFIFSEVNFQSTWRGRNTLSNTCYGISKNVWMAIKIFVLQFQNFTKQVEERLLLVTYNGHLTYVSLK